MILSNIILVLLLCFVLLFLLLLSRHHYMVVSEKLTPFCKIIGLYILYLSLFASFVSFNYLKFGKLQLHEHLNYHGIFFHLLLKLFLFNNTIITLLSGFLNAVTSILSENLLKAIFLAPGFINLLISLLSF